MTLVWVIIGGTAVLPVASAVAIFRRPSPYQQAQREYLEARERVDAVFSGAKVRMEEVAGVRRPGERRVGDGFGGWKGWL